MVSISTVTSGNTVLFYELPTSEFRTETARVSRAQTLDGGAVIDHRGFADGDRTFKIYADLDETTADDLWTLFKNETSLHISCSEGFFTGVIDNIKEQNGITELTFFVEE